MPELTPQQFVEKWARTELKESASAQSHFNDLCRLVGHKTPAELDPAGSFFTFEAGVQKIGGGQGYADVWYKDHFAIEYKGKGKYDTLDGAYQQLLRYRENLGNPPVLVVCDIENWEIHTNFTGTEKHVFAFTNADVATSRRVLRMLHWLFEDPYQFHPDRTTEQVTGDAAEVFGIIAENMRAWDAAPDRIAHFLTKLVFSLFAEDVGLLPAGLSGRGIFTEIVSEARKNPANFVTYTEQLFRAMADGGSVLLRDIPWFDGNLFDDVQVEPLSFEAMNALEKACLLDWSAVEPAIFGTLFERSLDPSKRAQLGAHYTSRDDILLIVEPVLMQPLRREWEQIQEQAGPIRAQYDAALNGGTRRQVKALGDKLHALREDMLERLRSVTVLDPACGSGNFLYVALQLLKDLEKEVINSPLFANLTLAYPEVHPRQLYGIEINPIAHDLASIVVWIGYIQWQQNNGYLSFKEPILEPLDNIRLMDAILAYDADGNPVEPEWPAVDVIVSNPPFLGGYKRREQLGEDYLAALFELYDQRVPNDADLVCYWYERAREHLATHRTNRAGLLATNSIRGGSNRVVLDRIKRDGDIFMAWSDREWILEGAAVRVSMVGFDRGTETDKKLDGNPVSSINSDLTADVDLTSAKTLEENSNMLARGIETGGPFELTDIEARQLLANPENTPVIVPIVNGKDIAQRRRNTWIIDFGQTPEVDPPDYSDVYSYLYKKWQITLNDKNRKRPPAFRDDWWEFRRSGEKLREILDKLDRYVCTPRVAKHRLFVWIEKPTIPDSATFVFARDDEYFFGVLHSRFHERWALRMGTWLGKGNDPRYTPTTTFETFPFPWPPGSEPIDHPAYQAISAAAKQLHQERDAWLNPPGIPESKLKDRTLTNLYNALAVFRGDPPPPGKQHPRIKAVAGDFAPRLGELHETLDRAVCDAYGWPYSVLDDDEEILRRLLALNLGRAGRPDTETHP